MSDPRSMGDLFRERRAAAAAASSGNNAGGRQQDPPPQTTRTRPTTFADIQREQQQQRQQQQQQHRYREQRPADDHGHPARHGGSNNGDPRGIGGIGIGIGGGPRQYGNNNNANTGRRAGNNNNGGGGGRPNHHHHRDHRAALPIEQGVIHTLLDKFGFIKCADRNKELFFHYSEFKEGHSDELNIGDEVEFKVGRAEERGGRRATSGNNSGIGGEEKMSAFNVRRLPEGTIYWEKEDEPVGTRRRGFIDRTAREEHPRGHRGGPRDRNAGKSAATDGVIRIVDDQDGTEIRYATSDYAPAKPGRDNRLDRKDVVEFTLVTMRRTGEKHARNVTLIQSERDRLREEREAELLKDARLEMGVVASDKGDYGFLRSTSRSEQVRFHVAHVLLPQEGKAEDSADSKSEVTSRGTLEEGTNVQFYVIDESGGAAPSSGDRRGSKKVGKGLSARKIKVLPKGTVKFEHKIAEGVAGRVTECPVSSGMEPFGRRDDRRKNDRGGGPANPKVGKIRLQEEIVVTNDEGAREVITHVLLPPDLYPGGTFAISRTGTEVGSWIRPGDVLLFDVVKKVIDGTCRAAPTASLRPGGGTTAAVDTDAFSSPPKPAVRLIEPSLCGRAEGVIRHVVDNYGFIHLAERNVDAYLPLFEVFPAEIQGDLVRNNPDMYHVSDLIRNHGGRMNVEVGMEVSFDLSLQMLSNSSGGTRAADRGRYSKQSRSPAAQEKESLRARRVQILPKGAVKEKVAIAEGVRATVIKEDPKQPFVGTLELEEPLKVDSGSQRHPLVSKLLDSISEGKYGEEKVVFHDTLSERDAQVVISMVNSRNDDLEATYIPKDNAAGDNGHTRKLCITRKKIDDAEEEESDQPVTSSVFSESASKEACDEKQQTPLDEEKGVVAASAEGTASAVAVAAKKLDFPKKKSKKVKIVKSLRFDKFSFPDMSIGPLGVGDVVTCNISQSRLSGAFIVENIMVLARKERSVALVSDEEEGKQNTAAISQRSFTGFVTEVVSNRQFGFITAVDEQGSKTGEHVFFHFKEVDYPVAVSGGDGDIAQDGSPPSSSAMSKNPGRSDAAIIRKGDEVKFDVRPGKNGKTTATNVSILPRGTLNTATNKTDNKSPTCTGYILMEPSHTSLANTPSHAVLQSGLVAGGGGGSRWDNVRDDKSTSQSGSNAKEGGVILLLSDPSHLFSPKPKLESHGNTSEFVVGPSKKNSGTDVSSPTEIKNTGNHPVKAADSKDDEGTTVEGMHLLYKTSSIVAVRGFSASANNRRNDGPKRGDLVRFGKTRGAKLVKDIRIEKMGAAASVTGVLTDINKDDDTAIFVSSDTIDGRYAIKLTEVVSCDKSLLKDNEQVDGILHQGKIFGVCRTKDIYLASSFGRKSGGSNSSGGLKERPKLNLTVKKELQGMGGQIMAQSRMAKGPDGTNGFAPEWTKRTSLYAATEEEEEYTRSLSAAASEFVPNFTMIAASGFESLENTTVE